MTDLVKRLRSTRADMLGTDDEEHYWDCHEAANEIERLEAVADAARKWVYYETADAAAFDEIWDKIAKLDSGDKR